MASSAEILQKAIQAARAGQRTEARDLLIELVEADPQNEMAWMWLSGLVDCVEDQIIACENVLTINPANEKVSAYLANLQRQYAPFLAKKNNDEATALLNEAKAHAERNEIDLALQLAAQSVEKRDDCEEAWLLISRISPNIDQRIAALEKASRLNPSNKEVVSALKQARYRRSNPLGAAARLEEAGKFEEALALYKIQAAVAKNLKEFEHVNKRIIHIERLRSENIHYVTPAASIARLTFVWPLLYLSLALVQMGLNPFRHPNFYLWLGLPLVILGGFLLSVAEVRSHHMIWERLFHELEDGSLHARSLIAVTGCFLILVPHVLLIIDSLNRLQNFAVPPMPF